MVAPVFAAKIRHFSMGEEVAIVSRKVRKLLLLLLLFFALTIQFICLWMSNYRMALPVSASEVKEHSVNLFVDYQDYLTAKISEAEFEKYVRRFGFSKSDKPAFFSADFAPEWWIDCPEDVEVLFKEWEHSGRKKIFAQIFYYQGKMYLLEYSI